MDGRASYGRRRSRYRLIIREARADDGLARVLTFALLYEWNVGPVPEMRTVGEAHGGPALVEPNLFSLAAIHLP